MCSSDLGVVVPVGVVVVPVGVVVVPVGVVVVPVGVVVVPVGVVVVPVGVVVVPVGVLDPNLNGVNPVMFGITTGGIEVSIALPCPSCDGAFILDLGLLASIVGMPALFKTFVKLDLGSRLMIASVIAVLRAVVTTA